MVYVLQVCCVQWKTRDDGQRNCPKHVEFYSKNKFEKLVHPVGFIIRVLDVKKNKINKNWTSHQMCCSTSDVMCCSTLLPFSSKALWLSSFIGLSFFGLIIIPILMSLYRLKLVLFSVCLFSYLCSWLLSCVTQCYCLHFRLVPVDRKCFVNI